MMEAVEKRLCRLFCIDKLAGGRRIEKIYARMIFVKYFADNGRTLSSIGERIGIKHPSVLHSRDRFKDEYKYNKYFKKMYDEFMSVPIFDTMSDKDELLF